MATTTNYGWTTPDDTALVKDGASAIRTLGSSVDTTTKALNPSTTLGDIEYRSSTANTNTRLPIGTTGQILTVAGGVPSWGAAPSSGGMTLITTTTFNNSAATYTYSSLGSYKHLLVVIDNLSRASASSVDNLVMQFNGVTTGTPYNSVGFGLNGASFGDISGNASNYLYFGYRVIANSATAAADRGNFNGWIYDYAGSTIKTFSALSKSLPGSNYSYTTSGNWQSTAAITSITIFTESGSNFNTGTLKLYGVS